MQKLKIIVSGGGTGGPACAPITGAAGGPGIVILRSTTYLKTDSACAPVSSPDGGTSEFIAKFKASANLIVGGSAPSLGLDYLVVGGGGAGGGYYGSCTNVGGGGGAGVGITHR